MNSEKSTWWDRLCLLLRLSWDVPDAPPAPPASAELPSTPPAPAAPPLAQSIYQCEARLSNLKIDIHNACGLFLQENDNELSSALQAGAVIIVEVAATTEIVTVHSVPQEDMATFASLAEWASFECSGREGSFDSMFYRVDVEPFQVAREHRLEGGTLFIPHLAIGRNSPASEEDDDDENEGSGNELGRKPGDGGEEGGPEAAPVPVRPRPPRSR